MADRLNVYTRINRVHNMEVATSLDGTNSKNYVVLLSDTHDKSTMDLPLKDMVKVYLEVPDKS